MEKDKNHGKVPHPKEEEIRIQFVLEFQLEM
jgi:hypothetical protein